MKGLVYVIIIVACLFGVYKCSLSSNKVDIEALMPTNNNGFTTIPNKFISLDTDRVIIYAPINCPSTTAQKADYLANELKRLKIPYSRINRFTTSADAGQITKEQWQAFSKKINELLNQSGPKVFIKGKLKADPTLDEIISEYDATK